MNQHKDSKNHCGGELAHRQEPEFIEGDVFRVIVTLDDGYFFDVLKEDGNGLIGLNKLDQSDHLDQSNDFVENKAKRHGTNRSGYWEII